MAELGNIVINVDTSKIVTIIMEISEVFAAIAAELQTCAERLEKEDNDGNSI